MLGSHGHTERLLNNMHYTNQCTLFTNIYNSHHNTSFNCWVYIYICIHETFRKQG